jgi:hypothetical protein
LHSLLGRLHFSKLYQVERELARQFTADDDAGRQRYRSAQTAAVRAEFHAWLLRKKEQVLPKAPWRMRSAMRYRTGER